MARRKRAVTVTQSYAGFLDVDIVEDALVSDLARGGQADEAPDVGIGRGPRSRALCGHGLRPRAAPMRAAEIRAVYI